MKIYSISLNVIILLFILLKREHFENAFPGIQVEIIVENKERKDVTVTSY